MKEKRTIKGVKENTQNYKGKAVDTIKKIVALALTLGIMITAAQAIRMYNRWRDSKTNGIGVENVQKLKKVDFENVKSLVEEYRQAKENNDTEKIKSLEIKLSEGNYFEVLNESFKEQVVKSLGYDPQKVKVVSARDGVFLVDKEKASGRLLVDHTGQINSGVKYIDKNGKNPPIPQEMKEMIDALGKDISFARYRSIRDLEWHYSNFEYVGNYEIEKDDFER